MKIVHDFWIFLEKSPSKSLFVASANKKERARNKIDRILFGISIINICWNAIFSNAESVNFTGSSLLLWKLMKIWKVGGLIFIYFNLKSRSNNLNYRTKFRTNSYAKRASTLSNRILTTARWKDRNWWYVKCTTAWKKKKKRKKTMRWILLSVIEKSVTRFLFSLACEILAANYIGGRTLMTRNTITLRSM